ncbi:M48 family metallopeptidase [Reinekea marinisedimentorum]|uniref:Zn-dependent protease with chaperone function n=1 Tax=Reinekea marinisedimentorum TaxID=230495 RepID=A0A4R3I5T9_9GAMM|nr:M48 family metallopeptidase [Reinekea marinisedimentorum]TCS40157.1 Zn-dependent protease with chaperone function [Reinekea marinisedimentorum]
MDFFENQDRARKKTVQLVFLFMLGLVATLVAVNLVCFVAYWAVTSSDGYGSSPMFGDFSTAWQSWWGSNLNWQVSWGILAAVVIGTAFRFLELAGGGKKVAEWAGATPVDMSSQRSEYRQLINVCEEMAIAAGMPVPELYVMEREQGINAFVAGYKINQAVLVVTKGALEHLTRDQLQGVIGHEYSHILNGDMRLNVRLMAFLAGLVMIGQIGRFLFHSGFSTGHRRSYRSRDNDGRLAIVLVAAGVLFVAVGYIGVLVGRMIKAAVSRQREFLADASSVQFTRNPDGIAGALYEIKSRAEGSQLAHRHAEDMSHFCFGETVALSDRLATHPPILERIKRVNPNFIAKERTRRRQTESAEDSVARSAPDAFNNVLMAAGVAALAGQVSPDQVKYAQKLYKHIPEQVKIWVHQSEGAKAFIYGQVMLGNDELKQSVLDEISQRDPKVMSSLKNIWPYCKKMDEQLRQPILEIALATLKRLPESERVIFLDRLEFLVQLDGRVDFIEWVTLTLTRMRLQQADDRGFESLGSNLTPHLAALSDLFRILVEQSRDVVEAEQMYKSVCERFGIVYQPNKTLQEVGFDKLSSALLALQTVSFSHRKAVLQACADIIQSDGEIDFREYEVVRIIAECLECPMPVLVLSGAEAIDERDIPIPFS